MRGVADDQDVTRAQRPLGEACSSGVLARTARRRVGPAGPVTGLDASPEMLAVARRGPQPIGWIEGRAEALPRSD